MGAPPVLVMVPVAWTVVFVIVPIVNVPSVGYVTVGVAAAWVTDTVRGDAPWADTVIVPERWLVVVLAAAIILKEPLFEPPVGVIVNQETLLFTFQVLLEVTFTDKELPPLGALHEEWDRFRVAAAGRVLNVIGGLCSVPVVPDTLTIARA